MPMKIETEIKNEMCVNSNQVLVSVRFFVHFYRAHFIAHSNLFNAKIYIYTHTEKSYYCATNEK